MRTSFGWEVKAWFNHSVYNNGLLPFAEQMLDCTHKICDNELVGSLQRNKRPRFIYFTVVSTNADRFQ